MELTLPQGLPGFRDLTRAQLLPIADEDLPGVYAELVDHDSPVRFLLARPAPFFPDYVIDVDDAALAVVGADEDDIDVWVVLARGTDGFTANLRGPVLVNRSAGVAVQAVLDDVALPSHAPLI